MNSKKKILMGIIAICLVGAIAAGFSLSYLSDSVSKTNTFVVGDDVDVDIEEPNWPVDPPIVKPGQTIGKDPTAIALEGDSYMRMKLEVVDYATGNVITDQTRINMILDTIYYDNSYAKDPDSGKWLTTNIVPGTAYTADAVKAYKGINSTEFEKDTTRTAANGVIYYNYINTATNNVFKPAAAPAENRAVLFTNVVVPSDWDKAQINLLRGTEKNPDDQKSGYQIVLTVQAIQTDGFATAEDGYKALDAAAVA